jgi:hypothetical protein
MSDNQAEQDLDRLRAQIETYHTSALAFAAVKLGLPGKMAARQWLGLSPPHLFRFLRGLVVTVGICEEHANGFALTSLGRSLAPGSPSRLGKKAANRSRTILAALE